MQLFDFKQPFFRPLWIRLSVVALCLGWGAFEFYSGAPLWGTLFVGIGAYCAWALLVTFQPDADVDPED